MDKINCYLKNQQRRSIDFDEKKTDHIDKLNQDPSNLFALFQVVPKANINIFKYFPHGMQQFPNKKVVN